MIFFCIPNCAFKSRGRLEVFTTFVMSLHLNSLCFGHFLSKYYLSVCIFDVLISGSWLWLSASIIDSSRPRKMDRLDVGICRLCTGMYIKTFELLIKRIVASKGLQCGSQKRQTQLQIIWRVLSDLIHTHIKRSYIG